jgi:hypothetical protein
MSCGIERVGPLPHEIQMIVESAASQALLEFFSTPDSASAFMTKGLESLR